MSLYQFFTSHEPNYIHNSIYVRVIKKQQFFSPHTYSEGQSAVPFMPSEGTAALKYFCKKLR